MSAGTTSAIPSSDGLEEARRDNAMASRVSFAAAKEEDERDERDEEGGGTPIPDAVCP